MRVDEENEKNRDRYPTVFRKALNETPVEREFGFADE